MKKIFIIIFLSALLSSFPLPTEAEQPKLELKDETVTYSPEGYAPIATCENEEILPFVSYFAIDVSTSAPVSIPITEPGTYQIFASFGGNDKFESEEVSSTVTITPVEAKILTDYHTVAYSRMENPIPYKIEPEWAEEFLDISIDYYPIESIDAFPEEKISAPTDLGLYYTVFNVSPKTNGVICENKYLVYEIAPYRGKKLSDEDQAISVPSSFVCTFRTVNAIYEENVPAKCSYVLSPAAISGEILYRQVFSNGTYSEYTAQAPIEPGEYMCAYFLGGTCIGEGSIFIEKKSVIITVSNMETEYIMGGIYPAAQCETEDVELAFTAFVIDENGEVTMEEVALPITKCGKYSVIAYPKDTVHYKRSYGYGYLDISPATPDIQITETSFIYDGTEKNIGVKITPSEVPYIVEYYEWTGEEDGIPLGSSPTRAGKYMAVITTCDETGNYVISSKTALMYIDEAHIHLNDEDDSMSKLEITLISVLGFVGLGIIVLLTVVFIKMKSKPSLDK